MKAQKVAMIVFSSGSAVLACASLPTVTSAQLLADPALTAYIAKIRAVDNHSHANSVAPHDADLGELWVTPITPPYKGCDTAKAIPDTCRSSIPTQSLSRDAGGV